MRSVSIRTFTEGLTFGNLHKGIVKATASLNCNFVCNDVQSWNTSFDVNR